MQAEKSRLKRLRRLERLRAIAKQAALAEAAQAEATLARMTNLAARTDRLVAESAERGAVTDGMGLAHRLHFSAGLQSIRTATLADAERAQAAADVVQTELASAERRRAVVEGRAEQQARAIAAKSYAPPLGARRRFGTGFE